MYVRHVGVLLGNGDGTFQTAVTYGSGGYYAYSVAVADVNGDGKPDLLVANYCANGQLQRRHGRRAHQYQHRLYDNCTDLFTQSIQLRTSRDVHGYGDSATASLSFTPTGTVSFYDGTTNIGNSNLNSSGVATLTTSTLCGGYAQHDGDVQRRCKFRTQHLTCAVPSRAGSYCLTFSN